MTRLTVLPCLLAGLLAVLFAACGSRSGRVDRASYDSVYAVAQQAAAAGDLETLWPLLSPDGQKGLERLLRDWQKQLQDEVRGRFILERIEARRGALDPDEIERARYGELPDVWRFYVAAEPRLADPPRRAARLSVDGSMAVIEYEAPRGVLREVRLVRTDAGWAIANFPL